MTAYPSAMELVRQAIRGDADSLGRLCLLYRPSIHDFLYRFLSSRKLECEAEDLTADVMADMVAAFHRFDPTRNIGGWVRRIARDRAIDFLERNRVFLRQVPLPEPENEQAGSDEGAFTPNPLDMLAQDAWVSDSPHRPPRQDKAGDPRKVSRFTKLRRRKPKEKKKPLGWHARLSRAERISRTIRRKKFAAEAVLVR